MRAAAALRIAKATIAWCVISMAQSCGSSESQRVTTVRVHARFEASWHLTQLAFHSDAHDAKYPTEPASLGSQSVVDILLDDKAAGDRLHIDLWGLSEGGRIAHA